MSLNVFLIGAGPGEAGLLTVRGAETLSRADVVFFDERVGRDVLALIPSKAERVSIGDPASGSLTALEKALGRLGEFEGRMLAILSGADPGVFGQSIAESAALQSRNIPFQMIPGVSAHIAQTGFKGIPGAQGPLTGKRVVVTRSRGQAGKMSELLRAQGAVVLEVPTIRIAPPTETKDFTDALVELNSYDWIIFTSANGVTGFFDLFFKGFDDLRDIGGVRIAAVGPSTAEKLKELHLKVDVMPKEFIGVKVAEALAAYESIENLKILLARAEGANSDLPKKLEEMGAIVDDVACYKTVPETEDVEGAASLLESSGADWVTFTSGSTVENFHARFNLPTLLSRYSGMKVASIGPETSKALAALGVKPHYEAREHTVDGLVRGLARKAS
jgi:uroporphyrinogen-III synthase